MQSWEVTLDNSLATSYKSKHIPTLWSNSYTLSYLLKRNKKCLHKNTWANIYKSFICRRQQLGTTEMSTNKRINKQIVVYPYNGTLLSHQSNSTTDTHCNLDALQNTSGWVKEASHKKSTFCIIPYIWSSTTGNSHPWWKKKSQQWLFVVG